MFFLLLPSAENVYKSRWKQSLFESDVSWNN